MSHRKHLILGVFLALLAYFSTASSNAFVKSLGSSIHPFQILLVQNIFGVVVVFLLGLMQKKNLGFYKTHHFGLVFMRAAGGFFAFLFLIISVHHISVTNATLLLNTGPFFLPIALFLFYKEPINHWIWIAIALGFIGIVLILHPNQEVFNGYSLLPIISGMMLPVVFISLKKLHTHQESLFRIVFYVFFFGAFLALPLGLLYWKSLSLREWETLLCAAIASFCAQTAITFALKYGSSQVLGPLCYSSVVFALILDKIFWNLYPTSLAWMGIVLVVIGGIFAIYIETHSKPKMPIK